MSKDCKNLLKGDALTTGYKKNDFENACFYHLEGDKYKELTTLKNINNLDTTKIILAYRKK